MKTQNQRPAETNPPDSEIDVEAIMTQVREKLQANRRAAFAQGLEQRPFTFDDYPEEPASGAYDLDLYAHLRQVNQPHKILGVRRMMQRSALSRLPLLGLLWQWIQRSGHDLVIFYITALANEVVALQRHVAGVLNRLVGRSQTQADEIKRLREEIETLKERIDLLEARR